MSKLDRKEIQEQADQIKKDWGDATYRAPNPQREEEWEYGFEKQFVFGQEIILPHIEDKNPVDYLRDFIRRTVASARSDERRLIREKIEKLLVDIRGQIKMTQGGMPYKLALEGYQSGLLDVLATLSQEVSKE